MLCDLGLELHHCLTQIGRKRRLKGGWQCKKILGIEAVHTNYATVLVEFWVRK